MLPQVAPVLKACTTAFQLSLCPQMPTTGGSGRGGRVGGRDTSDRHRGSEQFGVRSGDTEVQAVLPARRGGRRGPSLVSRIQPGHRQWGAEAGA